MTVADYRVGFKGLSKLDVCEAHKSFGKGMNREGFTQALKQLAGRITVNA